MTHKSKRARTIIRAVAALLWLSAVAGAGYTQAGRSKEQYPSLPDLMKGGVHEQFTFISFTIFHNAPLDARKLRSLARTASQLNEMARQIPEFKSAYLGPVAEQLGPALEARAEELAKAAQVLSEAARKGNGQQLENLFEKLEVACNNCHTKFRKELAIEAK